MRREALKPEIRKQPTATIRLIATWALAEGVLGGVLHALKVPFTGLVVGSAAVVLLALLGRVVARPGELLRATLVVLIIKALLSPHAPLPAYLAVSFQGLMATLLLRRSQRPAVYRLTCVALGGLALTESAIQKLLVLTLLLGQGFWQAADGFLQSILEQLGVLASTSGYARWLAGGFVGLHVVVGLAVGGWAGWLATAPAPRARQLPDRPASIQVDSDETVPLGDWHRSRGGGRRWWTVALLATLATVVLLLEPTWLPRHAAVRLVVRVVTLLLIWQWLLGPVLQGWVRTWLLRQRRYRLAADVDAVLDLLPETKLLLRQAWQDTASPTLSRWPHFVRLATIRLLTIAPPAADPVAESGLEAG